MGVLPTVVVDGAVREAVDVAVSARELPAHFDTDDDTLPSGEPSYVNVRATSEVSCSIEVSVAGATVSCGYNVLGAFEASAAAICQESTRLVPMLASGLAAAADVPVVSADIAKVSCV